MDHWTALRNACCCCCCCSAGQCLDEIADGCDVLDGCDSKAVLVAGIVLGKEAS